MICDVVMAHHSFLLSVDAIEEKFLDADVEDASFICLADNVVYYDNYFLEEIFAYFKVFSAR